MMAVSRDLWPYTRLAHTLRRGGVYSLDQIAQMSDEQLLSIRNMGASLLVLARSVCDKPDALFSRHVTEKMQPSTPESPICDNILSERERMILTLRVEHGQTLKAVGEQVGVSPERIRQITDVASRKIYRARRNRENLIGQASKDFEHFWPILEESYRSA